MGPTYCKIRHLQRCWKWLIDDLILRSGTGCVETNHAQQTAENTESQSDWVKTPVANLVRYKPSGTYFARVRTRGKLFRQTLDTNGVYNLTVGTLRMIRDCQKAVDNAARKSGAPRTPHLDLRHLFASAFVGG